MEGEEASASARGEKEDLTGMGHLCCCMWFGGRAAAAARSIDLAASRSQCISRKRFRGAAASIWPKFCGLFGLRFLQPRSQEPKQTDL